LGSARAMLMRLGSGPTATPWPRRIDPVFAVV
jgi:hypothetical protein